MNLLNGVMLVTVVAAEAYFWWLAVSLLTNRFRQRALKNRTAVNRILGTILALFGLIIVVKTII